MRRSALRENGVCSLYFRSMKPNFIVILIDDLRFDETSASWMWGQVDPDLRLRGADQENVKSDHAQSPVSSPIRVLGERGS